ncbi:1,5-anhydro-D-fructose reductase [Pseudovibrio sp. W64]|uniref:Gfo/Idh/MocA family protein n=1 Tax=unclassified Pseudovibrio TaxID=2627060 RepID=UPI0007AE3EC9|nr:MULTISPECIES: Gfo/Idh/MocA family oxidoreductase [unclassified Pseudovibrio]KZK76165.1 1,5-anhydro-D-fructose reductase [Pseudovibrio sp. Ad46]KZK79972.1 1,5-anhydro-D-fructose reductase [Pseudovibrio sp. Ad13]KZK84000.1 1,5-anhydro-D-fructose reductase [Pseudovibrio sp. W64]KZK92997.1 1,5-anhydro-D-fructose reductase [Pseudovibrio sp. W74]KZK98086.1 1,5-anhydro-D-fructose reductase [Pseudovibrio sp. Ad5]
MVKWGVLSTARIGREKVIPALQKAKGVEVVAIASRNEENAKKAAAELGIEKAYGSYEALLADPDIDVIYNPLPNHMHVPMTIEAVKAGKHVLCEKPIALDADEARLLLEMPDNRFVMEAFMVRAHPQWQRALEIVESGELGKLQSIQAFFGYSNQDPQNIRNKAELGGGGLMDIGCYPIVASRYFFDAEPERVVSLVDRDRNFGTDRLTSVMMDFGEGRQAQFTVSTQSAPYQRINLVGTAKRLEILIPFNAPAGEETILRLDSGSLPGDGAIEVERVAACDQYTLQGELFSRVVKGEEELPYGVADAIQNMEIIDAIVRSERNDSWETVGSPD